MGKRVILASSSPRRKELLKTITENFDIIVSGCDETVDASLSPSETVMELAKRKGMAVYNEADCPQNALIIASDTVVALDGTILGKPADKDEAFHMLKSLSGRLHHVYSGVCIIDTDESGNVKTDVFYEETAVSFMALSDEEIDNYVKSGEPYDKAGGYGIQGLAGKFITSINGDYYNVVGLPLPSVYKKIRDLI